MGTLLAQKVAPALTASKNYTVPESCKDQVEHFLRQVRHGWGEVGVGDTMAHIGASNCGGRGCGGLNIG